MANVDFTLYRGEILALIGENGAGKSTLMKILSGVYEKDSGSIKISGEEVDNLSPLKAQEHGVAIIHQELNMCEDLSVSENIFLGREITTRGRLDKKKMYFETRSILEELETEIDPNDIVGNLPVSQQQMVEIAKALSMNSKILIMDEPTSALTDQEVEKLFSITRKLKSKGHAIVYISHKMEELKEISDRVFIMRDGKHIITEDFDNITISEIISHMVGREIDEQFPYLPVKKGQKILEVKNLNTSALKNINFSLHEGEIVGISGLMGAGRTELTRAIFGADPINSGHIILEGEEISITNPRDAIQSGIVLVPEDRKKDGLCTEMSIKENIALPNLDLMSNKLGIINQEIEEELVKKTIQTLSIKTPSENIKAESLSGGNQQKIVVGKWLLRNSKVVIFDEPTRGIDVGAKVSIYNLMNQLKKDGISVLFVSSELPEVMGLSDRVLVMCDGKITGEIPRANLSQDKIMTLATQFK